jgi:hypothetical protein
MIKTETKKSSGNGYACARFEWCCNSRNDRKIFTQIWCPHQNSGSKLFQNSHEDWKELACLDINPMKLSRCSRHATPRVLMRTSNLTKQNFGRFPNYSIISFWWLVRFCLSLPKANFDQATFLKFVELSIFKIQL